MLSRIYFLLTTIPISVRVTSLATFSWILLALDLLGFEKTIADSLPGPASSVCCPKAAYHAFAQVSLCTMSFP